MLHQRLAQFVLLTTSSSTRNTNNCINTSSIVNNYNATVLTSDTVNNLVSINNFGAFGSTVSLYATFTGTAPGSSITMPAGPSVSSGGTAYFSAQYPANSFVVTGSSSSQSFTTHLDGMMVQLLRLNHILFDNSY